MDPRLKDYVVVSLLLLLLLLFCRQEDSRSNTPDLSDRTPPTGTQEAAPDGHGWGRGELLMQARQCHENEPTLTVAT